MMLSVSRHGLSRIAVLAAVLFFGLALGTAVADQWNDRTILKFDKPVRIPGATLQPGTYVFKLVHPGAASRTVAIEQQDGTRIALVQAIPMKRSRTEADGELEVSLYPGDAGSPVALKGWFYPGSLYGHQLIYPADEAREIAARAKTIVLSDEVAGSDRQQGRLVTFDASGNASQGQPDAATVQEWAEWQRNRGASATVARRADESDQSTAFGVKASPEGMRVTVDDLEDNARKYIGKKVSVDAAVENVLGPRVFSIDEPHWADLEGEILVYMPTTLAALVRENDRVTVTGTIKPFLKADFEKEWGWLGLDPQVEVTLSRKMVLVADRIVGGNDSRVLMIDSSAQPGNQAVGTSGSTSGSSSAAITDAANIANGDEDLVGQRVNLAGVKVEATAKDRGFFVKTQQGSVFVLPAERGGQSSGVSVQAGQEVSLNGVILQLPNEMKEKLSSTSGIDHLNRHIYIYATEVTK